MPSPLAPNNSPVIQVEPPQGQSSLHSQAVLQQSAASAAAAILFVLLGAHPNADEMLPGSSGLWLSHQVQRGSSGSVDSDASSVPPTVPRGYLSVGVQSAWLEPDATPLPVAPTVRYRSAQVAMASAAATPDGLIELEGDAPRVPATVKYKAGYQVAAGWGTPTQVRSTSLADHLEHRRLTGSPVVSPAANTDNHTASSAPGRLGGRARQVHRPLVWDDPFGS